MSKKENGFTVGASYCITALKIPTRAWLPSLFSPVVKTVSFWSKGIYVLISWHLLRSANIGGISHYCNIFCGHRLSHPQFVNPSTPIMPGCQMSFCFSLFFVSVLLLFFYWLSDCIVTGNSSCRLSSYVQECSDTPLSRKVIQPNDPGRTGNSNQASFMEFLSYKNVYVLSSCTWILSLWKKIEEKIWLICQIQNKHYSMEFSISIFFK